MFAAAWLTCSVTTLICDTAIRRIAGRAAPETRGVRSGRGAECDGEAAEGIVVRRRSAGVGPGDPAGRGGNVRSAQEALDLGLLLGV
jgi:hypothetical protein